MCAPHDPASILLSKAKEDALLMLLVLENFNVSDEMIGFHAQQAVEKAIKSVLARYGIVYRRTHDIAELSDLLMDNGISYPDVLNGAVVLTPFAAELRYGYLPPEEKPEQPFDREASAQLVRATLSWAEQIVSSEIEPRDQKE
jgi:HEPN domain-containing protein